MTIPTAKSSRPDWRSYQIGSIYSPVGMKSWVDLYDEYDRALNKPDGMRTFVQLRLGEPSKDVVSRPKPEKVIENKGSYKAGTVPRGVLFLTIGIDVQRGSEKDKENPPRLELEILGIGSGYRTYSINYLVFTGSIDDPYSGAWEKMHKWAEKTSLEFVRLDDGFIFNPKIVFIDSGDGVTMSTVYQFTGRWQNTFPSKGFQALQKRKTEKSDEVSTSNFKRFRATKMSEGIILYQISTSYYKSIVYNNLKIKRQHYGEWQKPGFCDFPIEYKKKYFDQLTAEDKFEDGSFNCPTGRRNEALDCRGMTLCGGDAYLDQLVTDLKEGFKSQGASAADLQVINTQYALQYLANETVQELMLSNPPGFEDK